jgi:hypothetical protein
MLRARRLLENEELKVELQRHKCKVILTGLKENIETPESFSIKFSLLTRVPVTKIKNIVRNLPSVVWEGYELRKADQLLALIEESGGTGEIVEVGVEEDEGAEGKSTAGSSEDGVVCPKCGYPIKEGQKYCEFCYSSLDVEDSGEKIINKSREGSSSYSIPTGRMIFYLCIVVVLILIAIFSNI